jgi:hypothetical protein
MLCPKFQCVGCGGSLAGGTSVGDAALAGVSMDGRCRSLRRGRGLPGTSGKRPETTGGGDPFRFVGPVSP